MATLAESDGLGQGPSISAFHDDPDDDDALPAIPILTTQSSSAADLLGKSYRLIPGCPRSG